MTETTVFNCLGAIKLLLSRGPLRFLLTSPKFASSTPLEVAIEAQNLHHPVLGDISAVRLGTNKRKRKASHRRSNRI